jgi:hypothetical protein
MAVPSVVKNIGMTTAAEARHHVWHHWTQTCPRHNLPGINTRKALLDPINQWPNTVSANIFVVAIELCSARDT